MARWRIEVTLPEDDPSEVLDRVIEMSGDQAASVEFLGDDAAWNHPHPGALEYPIG